MNNYSIAEAEDKLSELIDRAISGERVVITRDGAPLIEFKPIEPMPLAGKPITKADIEWLTAHCIEPLSPVDSGELLSKMRDEDDER